MLSAAYSQRPYIKAGIKIRALPLQDIEACSFVEKRDDNDVDNVIVVKSWKLLKENHLSNDQWVTVEPAANRSSSSQQYRFRKLVRIVYVKGETRAEEEIKDENIVLLSPMLMFNIGLRASHDRDTYIHIYPASLMTKELKLCTINKFRLPYAKKVVICRIKSSDTTGYEDFSDALRDFFDKPRVLSVGDIIFVPLSRTKYNIELNNNANDDENEEANVVDWKDIASNSAVVPKPIYFAFFKVLELHPTQPQNKSTSSGTFIVNCSDGNTTLLQAPGSVNSFIPNVDDLSSFYLKKNKQTIVSSKCFNKMYELLSPYFESFPSASEVNSNQNGDSILGNQVLRGSILLYGAKGTGKCGIVNAIANRFGVHFKQHSLTGLRGLPEDQVAEKLREIFKEANEISPCVLLLRNISSLARPANGSNQPDDPTSAAAILQEAILDKNNKFIIVGSCSDIDSVPQIIRGTFYYEINIEAPDLDERKKILKSLILKEEAQASKHKRVHIADNVSIDSLAQRTAGRNALELKSLLANALLLSHKRNCAEEISNQDLDTAIDTMPTAATMDIGAPKIPSVYWDDVGGLGEAKDEIMNMVQLPLHRPELFASGVRARSGILLFGPPGTGKTLLAKAVATECSLNFISVKGPELLDMYIGESERKVRQVFELARSAKPAILFFDELDSLAPQRGRGSDSGGVMDRVVSQLLSELDGMQGNSDVFVIGATNRPDLLDQSLLRPGRFDRLIYLGISKDRSSQLKIVKALTRKYKHDPDVSLEAVLEKCPLNFTGADFYALCSGAMANSINRRVSEIKSEIDKYNKEKKQDENDFMTPRRYLAQLGDDELTVKVKMVDYEQAIKTTIPSVSAKELLHYESLREKFSTHAAKQDNTQSSNEIA